MLCDLIVQGTSVISRGSEHVTGQCDHEEADTRIVVHVRHVQEEGTEYVLVRTVETDIVVKAS